MNITTTYDEAMVKAMIAEAVAKEREACAKVCDDIEMKNTRQGSADCAAAIRARSKRREHMTDEEFLEAMEAKAIWAMLTGCATQDHLGEKKYDVGCWSVGLRADELSRLVDMARSNT